jgi:phosphoadenosine phosphosulfate reductase
MPRSGGRREVYPILWWNHYHVWKFIEDHEVPYCGLYDEGFDRLGCVGCPMATEAQRRIEFARWPRYEKLWRDACEYVITERARRRLSAPPQSLLTGLSTVYFDEWMKL